MTAFLMAAALAFGTEDCVAVGDSLAVGMAMAINARVRGTSCRIAARKGAPASRIARTMSIVRADVILLSAGANDAASPSLMQDLAVIRARAMARQIIWVMPRHPRAAAAVRATCRYHGDVSVDLARFRTGDGIHPSDYDQVARAAFHATTCQ